MALPNALTAILKRLQSKYFDDKSLVRKSDFMKWIEHKKDFQTSTINFAFQPAGLGGASHTVGIADGYDVNGVYREFVVPSVVDYKNCSLDGPTTRKVLEGDINTQYVNLVKNEMANGYESLEQRLATGVFRNGTGSRGQISAGSTVGSATITLATPDDALYWNIGDQVVASAADGGALKTGGAGFVTLIAVNTATGELTADQNWSAGITAPVAVNDFLYKRGDAQNNGTAVDYLGLTAWNPTGTVTATPFCGVDRSINPEQLAGLRFPVAGLNVETCLIAADAYATKRPGMSFDEKVIVMSTNDFASLQISKEGSRIVSQSIQGAYGIGIDTFKLGKSHVMSDIFCPDGRYFLVGKGAFELRSNKGVHINDGDGNKIQRRNGDTYQFQTLIDANFVGVKPNGIGNGVYPNT